MNERTAIAPSRIVTERLVLRCWEPRDAAMLVEAITENLDHLRPWMPWAAREPETVDEKASRIQTWRRKFLLGRQFWYGLFTPNEDRVLGGIGMHRDIGSGAASIGYWLRKECTGRGLVTEATAALTRIGFERQHLIRMEIHCDPKNTTSAGVPQRLGYAHELTIANCVRTAALSPRDSMIWMMSGAAYRESAAASVAYKTNDDSGVFAQ